MGGSGAKEWGDGETASERLHEPLSFPPSSSALRMQHKLTLTSTGPCLTRQQVDKFRAWCLYGVRGLLWAGLNKQVMSRHFNIELDDSRAYFKDEASCDFKKCPKSLSTSQMPPGLGGPFSWMPPKTLEGESCLGP